MGGLLQVIPREGMSCWVTRVGLGVLMMALGLAPAWASNVMAVNITGSVLSGPNCFFFGGSGNGSGTRAALRIEVSFGDTVQTSMVDGSNYQQPIPFLVSCTAQPANVRFKFSGGGSAFDPSVLGTNFADLGVKLLKPDGTQLVLDEWFNFTYSGTVPLFKSVPVKRPGSVLPTGAFGASTTLVLEVP